MATITYLPAPIKVEHNLTDSKPDALLWAGCSIALGIFSYYAPKTFLATSVGIFAYQVYSFNQLVQTVDTSKHQRIHKWAINACVVMWSVGTVFGIKSLPYFWFACKDIRHLHLIHAVGHLAKGVIMIIVAGCLAKFSDSAKDLASRRRWVEMEDYVTNYPVEVKQNILSSYGKQLVFYISALLPQTGLASFFSTRLFESSQFQPENHKVSLLQRYFRRADIRQWPLAIHQFQQLPVANQISFGSQLNTVLQHHLMAERETLPSDVKAVLLNQTLTSYAKAPSYQEAAHVQWQALIAEFERLPREQQSVLGDELIRLINNISLEAVPYSFPEPMRLAALKACIQTSQMALGNALFEGLTDAFKTEFGLFLKRLIENNRLDRNQLSPQMQAILPRIGV